MVRATHKEIVARTLNNAGRHAIRHGELFSTKGPFGLPRFGLMSSTVPTVKSCASTRIRNQKTTSVGIAKLTRLIPAMATAPTQPEEGVGPCTAQYDPSGLSASDHDGKACRDQGYLHPLRAGNARYAVVEGSGQGKPAAAFRPISSDYEPGSSSRRSPSAS